VYPSVTPDISPVLGWFSSLSGYDAVSSVVHADGGPIRQADMAVRVIKKKEEGGGQERRKDASPNSHRIFGFQRTLGL
jgi:hypothetical protein